MAQRRRNSSALTKAERRIEGLQTINPDLDFGNGLSVATYNTMVSELREKLAAYNQARTIYRRAAATFRSHFVSTGTVERQDFVECA
jgi:hypothetical protein